MSFQPGAVVSLVTSSIPMTVESVSGDDITVVRHDAKLKTIRETYKAAALKPFQRGQRGRITFRLG